MALCDGSVLAIPYSIDVHIHDHLGNRADGHVIDWKKFSRSVNLGSIGQGATAGSSSSAETRVDKPPVAPIN